MSPRCRPALAPLELESRLVPANTQPELVRDVLSEFGQSSEPKNLTEADGVLYFQANDGVNGAELWRSDGTSSGTYLVRDIRPGVNHSYPSNLTNVGGLLYFKANDGIQGNELWRSDGTSSGTVLVRDIRIGPIPSVPYNLTNLNGVLFFSANNGVNGYELWRSDGTSSGTSMVRDIRPDTNGSYPRHLSNVNGLLYFNADDGIAGRELWRSDGTSSGTYLVRNINLVTGNSFPEFLTNVNGLLMFRANDGVTGYELWRSDGTSSGTLLVRDIRPGPLSHNFAYHTEMINVGGVLYFPAHDGVNGQELWRSDGTSSGTTLVRNINGGSAGGYPRYLVNVSGTIFFSAGDSTSGFELWRSDGTSSGTTVVDIVAGSASSTPQFLINVAGAVYFRARDSVNGFELWRSDGTASGTSLIDIESGTSAWPTLIPRLTGVGNQLYFAANRSDVGVELFTLKEIPGVSGVTVNNGDLQRSRLTTIVVAFDAILDVALFQNPGAVTLTRTAGGPGTVVTIGSGLVITPGAGNSNAITLTFQNASLSGVENGSLADGRWRLAVPSLGYQSALNSPNLRRLFGDVDANGSVDAVDFSHFGATFGGVNIAFDFDNNGTIDAGDFGQFGARFGVTL